MSFKLDIKRFYLPNKIEEKCPICDNPCISDETDYLMYPEVNKPIEVYIYCRECDESYPFNYQINLNIEKVKL